MRFLRFICNLLLLFVTSIFICSVSVGAYDLVACQDNFGLDKSSSVEVIHIIPSNDTVSMIDTYTFWGTDIAAGEKTAPKYRIRNWGNEWWQTHMKWADTALDATIAAVKPIVVPIAQVNAVKDYYLTEDYDINSVYHRYASNDNSIVSDAELYEMYVIFNQYTYNGFDIEKLRTSSGLKISEFDYENAEGRDREINTSNLGNEVEYMKWAKRHKNAYNTDWKLRKYNQDVYAKYFKKFVFRKIADIEKNGVVVRTEIRTVKSSIVVLTYIQLVSFILALIFVIKYPVAILQAKFEGKRRGRHLGNSGEA